MFMADFKSVYIELYDKYKATIEMVPDPGGMITVGNKVEISTTARQILSQIIKEYYSTIPSYHSAEFC